MGFIERIKSWFAPMEDDSEYDYENMDTNVPLHKRIMPKNKASVVVYDLDAGHMEEQAKTIIEDVKNNKITILNIRKMDKEEAQRLVDFLTGAAYAMSGTIKKLQDNLFLFTPPAILVAEEKSKN